jgi:hypothetical protein
MRFSRQHRGLIHARGRPTRESVKAVANKSIKRYVHPAWFIAAAFLIAVAQTRRGLSSRAVIDVSARHSGIIIALQFAGNGAALRRVPGTRCRIARRPEPLDAQFNSTGRIALARTHPPPPHPPTRLPSSLTSRVAPPVAKLPPVLRFLFLSSSFPPARLSRCIPASEGKRSSPSARRGGTSLPEGNSKATFNPSAPRSTHIRARSSG